MTTKQNKKLLFHDWGTINYADALQKQTEIFQKKVSAKRQLYDNNKKAKSNNKTTMIISNDIIFVEHYPVFTLGKSGNPNNLLTSKSTLENNGFQYFPINRGGDITYHGPGQLVIYPIIDLEQYYSDLNWYLRTLEQIAIDICNHYGIKAHRIDKLTGVWVTKENTQNRNPQISKICAFGVKVSRWITMHGLAFNVNTYLSHFNHIVPCGITDKSVTSLSNEIGNNVPMQEVKQLAKSLFIQHFDTLDIKKIKNK